MTCNNGEIAIRAGLHGPEKLCDAFASYKQILDKICHLFFLPAHTVLKSHVLNIMMLNKPKFV